MTVEVNVVVRVKENALLLPASAVEGNGVYIVGEAGHAHRRELEIGIRGTREIESCPASTKMTGSSRRSRPTCVMARR